MPSSATLIQRQTVSGSSTTVVSFTSIPQTYQDLRLVTSHRMSNNSAGDYLKFILNGDTGTNYDTIRWYANNQFSYLSAAAYGHLGNIGGGTSTNAYAFSISEADFLGYSSSSICKTWLYENGMADNDVDIAYFTGVGRWGSTAAITQLDVYAGTGGANFTSGSTFALWGISSS